MLSSAIMIEFSGARRAGGLIVLVALTAVAAPECAADCWFAPQGEGHVTEIIDARSFRLSDGREIRLAGIEPVVGDEGNADVGEGVKRDEKQDAKQLVSARAKPDLAAAALAALVAGHDVTLRGDDDSPDRYGRQSAFVFRAGSDTSVQSLLLAQGEALVAATVSDKDCAAVLSGAEAEARQARRGVWAAPAATKNAESPGDIMARLGRFAVVEGRILSVRQAGATTYLNFGRNWTRGFAVTIPKRVLPAFQSAGIVLKSLENRRVRVRGWIEARGGPRIEALRTGQVELLGEN